MREKLPRPQLAPARHLRRDPDVLQHVNPRDALGRDTVRGRHSPGQVVIGDPRQVEVARHRDPGPDRRPRVDLDELERPVAGVADELDVREALVADVAEEPESDLLDLGLAARLEDGARPEPQRHLTHLAPGYVRQGLALPADVCEQREDEVVRVRDQLLHDRVEAVLVRAAPDGHGGIGIGSNDRLLAKRACELLAFRRLDEERRLEPRGADRGLVAREHRRRRRHPGGRALGCQALLAAQAQDDFRVIGERHVGELADRIPVPQHEGNVLVALREEHRALWQMPQHLEHVLVRARQGPAQQVAGSKPELAPVERDPVNGYAVPAERARQRQPRVELAEDDRRPHPNASS